MFRSAYATPDLAELLRWQPQAAFILTPPNSHYALARQLLQAGSDVFLEKPATLQTQETEELARLADQRQAILMVGYNRRFAPLNVKARQIWGDRPVDMAVFEKHRYKAYHVDIYNNFLDDTVHMVDLLRFFCGEAQALGSTSQVRDGKFIGGICLVSLKRGGSGLIASSLSAGRWTERFALHGGGASLYVEAFSRLELVSAEMKQVWEETPANTSLSTSETRGIFDEVAHFFDCVKTRQQPLTSAWDSVKTQRLVDEIAGHVWPV
jgi:virulence factor